MPDNASDMVIERHPSSAPEPPGASEQK
jgi:hypothetical protein